MNKTKFNGKIPRKGANINKIYYPKYIGDVEHIVCEGMSILGSGLRQSHSRIDESRKKTSFINSNRIKHIYRVDSSSLESTKRLKRRLCNLIDPILTPREKHNFKDYFINVGSGVTLEELSDYLAKRGFALPVTSQYGKETIGGVSQTGTHGSGWYLGNIADYIVSLRIILPDGKVSIVEPRRKISKGDVINNTELFNSVCCGLGSLGFVYDVVLFVQDAVEYKSHIGYTKWIHFRGDLEEFVEDVRNLELCIDPDTLTVKVCQSGEFLRSFDYPVVKDKVKELSGVYLSTETAIPIYTLDEIQMVINASLFYIQQKDLKCFPLHVRFGKNSKHFLSSTYSDSHNVIGFVYIKLSMSIDKNADRNLRDLTNFEVFLNTYQGQVNFSYIQGGIISRPGLKKWGQVYKLFENNPFSTDFAEEIVNH